MNSKNTDSSKKEECAIPDKKSQFLLTYYGYLREDTITHQRISWAITFQGFLISASALLLVFGWPDPAKHADIELLRRLSIFGLGIIGHRIAHSSYLGVRAARRSVERIKEQWENTLSENGYSIMGNGPKFIPTQVP